MKIAIIKAPSSEALQSPWPGTPLVTGWLGLMCAIVAVGMPTAIRASVHGSVTGCEFTPYLPFILLAAVVIGWWRAGLVALASVAVLGGLFVGPPSAFLADSCARSAAGVFLGSSAIIIAIVTMALHLIGQLQASRSNPSAGGVIFSLDKGEVWASWNGPDPPLRLGSRERVEAMMEDFLAQGQLSKRLDSAIDLSKSKR